MNREHEEMVVEIAEELQLSQKTIDQRLSVLGITPEDIALIKSQNDWYHKNIDQILERFQQRFEDSRRWYRLSAESHAGEQLRDRIRRYFDELFSCEFNVQSVLRHLKVGVVHHAIMVEQQWYVAAYSWLLENIIHTVYSHSEGLNGAPEETISAFARVMMFDMGLVLETYNHANHQAIEKLAKHDVLTGLPNYNLLIEDLADRIGAVTDTNAVYVFFIGLNRFKAVNETLGHGIGDEILKKVAARLQSLIPEGGLLSRLGGDIFVIGASSGALSISADDFAMEIGKMLHYPVELDGFSVDVSATVGVAVAEDSGIDVQSLIGRAEMAMYHAKSRQLTRTMFNADMKRYSVAELGIGWEIRRAIDKNELVLFFQPKLDVRTGRVIGVEALIRWLHPVKGFMPPGLFIPLVEETVLIHPVTEWVLETAIKRASEWQKAGLDLIVSVNLSAANLQNIQLPDRLRTLLSENGLEPSRLMLEITESGLMADPRRARDTVIALKALGVKLSIDDFGTGYSSLAYLKTLPVDEVKIDQVFVFSMCKEKKDARIVRATIALGHSLGLEVSAEGVEDEETLDKLRLYDCDTVQGFLFSKPLPEDELEAWLVAQAGKWQKHLAPQEGIHPKSSENNDAVAFVEWKDEYAMCTDSVDWQHWNLFQTTNRLFEATRQNPGDSASLVALFDELYECVLAYFYAEEKSLEDKGDENLLEHVDQHRRFTQQLSEFRHDIPDTALQKEIISFLKAWMVNHFVGRDSLDDQYVGQKEDR